MKKIEARMLVLDRLMENLERGVQEPVNVLEELTGEISYRDLRSAIHVLSALGYIYHDRTQDETTGWWCSITPKGIEYYESVFESLPPQKKSLKEWVMECVEIIEGAKKIIFTVIIVCITLGMLLMNGRGTTFSFVASLFGIPLQDANDPEIHIYYVPTHDDMTQNKKDYKRYQEIIRKQIQNRYD